MPKCDFNNVAKQRYWIPALSWAFSRKFAAYFLYTFSKERLWKNAFVINVVGGVFRTQQKIYDDQLLSFFAKSSILDVLQVSVYASDRNSALSF